MIIRKSMITLTQLAAEKVSQQLERRGKGLGVRIGIKTTGCSGLAYMFEYVDKPNDDDSSFVSYGVHVFVDPKSLAYLQGVEVDWVKKGLNEGFDFKNPNERDRCGCGESFRV
jgi:iron-sulfur cluster assembly protein